MPTYPTTPFERAVDRAIARENAAPQGLPADVLAGMELDIRANPDRYPAACAALAKIDAERGA
jgi:hypothetical protein